MSTLTLEIDFAVQVGELGVERRKHLRHDVLDRLGLQEAREDLVQGCVLFDECLHVGVRRARLRSRFLPVHRLERARVHV